jgi:3-dehydroquinate dehydratase
MTNDQPGAVPDIETLTEQFQKLNKRKIESERDLVNAEKNLNELKQQAQEEYGTDQLEELKTKLQQIKDENARKRAEYHQSLEKIEAELTKIETAHNASDAP